MSEKSKKANLFDKSKSQDRAQKILEDNELVADLYTATQPNKDLKSKHVEERNLVESVMNKVKHKKQTHSFYIENRIDDFFRDFGSIIGTNKSEIVNELMLILINETEIMSELTDGNKEIQELIEDFRR